MKSVPVPPLFFPCTSSCEDLCTNVFFSFQTYTENDPEASLSKQHNLKCLLALESLRGIYPWKSMSDTLSHFRLLFLPPAKQGKKNFWTNAAQIFRQGKINILDFIIPISFPQSFLQWLKKTLWPLQSPFDLECCCYCWTAFHPLCFGTLLNPLAPCFYKSLVWTLWQLYIIASN